MNVVKLKAAAALFFMLLVQNSLTAFTSKEASQYVSRKSPMNNRRRLQTASNSYACDRVASETPFYPMYENLQYMESAYMSLKNSTLKSRLSIRGALSSDSNTLYDGDKLSAAANFPHLSDLSELSGTVISSHYESLFLDHGELLLPLIVGLLLFFIVLPIVIIFCTDYPSIPLFQKIKDKCKTALNIDDSTLFTLGGYDVGKDVVVKAAVSSVFVICFTFILFVIFLMIASFKDVTDITHTTLCTIDEYFDVAYDGTGATNSNNYNFYGVNNAETLIDKVTREALNSNLDSPGGQIIVSFLGLLSGVYQELNSNLVNFKTVIKDIQDRGNLKYGSTPSDHECKICQVFHDPSDPLHPDRRIQVLINAPAQMQDGWETLEAATGAIIQSVQSVGIDEVKRQLDDVIAEAEPVLTKTSEAVKSILTIATALFIVIVILTILIFCYYAVTLWGGIQFHGKDIVHYTMFSFFFVLSVIFFILSTLAYYGNELHIDLCGSNIQMPYSDVKTHIQNLPINTDKLFQNLTSLQYNITRDSAALNTLLEGLDFSQRTVDTTELLKLQDLSKVIIPVYDTNALLTDKFQFSGLEELDVTLTDEIIELLSLHENVKAKVIDKKLNGLNTLNTELNPLCFSSGADEVCEATNKITKDSDTTDSGVIENAIKDKGDAPNYANSVQSAIHKENLIAATATESPFKCDGIDDFSNAIGTPAGCTYEEFQAFVLATDTVVTNKLGTGNHIASIVNALADGILQSYKENMESLQTALGTLSTDDITEAAWQLSLYQVCPQALGLIGIYGSSFLILACLLVIQAFLILLIKVLWPETSSNIKSHFAV